MKKWIKKINIFMCCLLLCFCSVVAKPKEVQALIGVDDLALATIGLMGLSLLGIGITENINENYDTYKKVALNTYNSMCDFVGQAWEDMCLSAYNTGQFALTQLNNVKSNIQDWYNNMITSNNSILPSSSVSDIAYNYRHTDNLYDIGLDAESIARTSKIDTYKHLASDIDLIHSSNYEFLCFRGKGSYGYFFDIYFKEKNDYKFVVSPGYGSFPTVDFRCSTYNVKTKQRGYPAYLEIWANTNYKPYGSYYKCDGPIYDSYDYDNTHIVNGVTDFFYTNASNLYVSDYRDISSADLFFYKDGVKWIGSNSLELPLKGSNPLDGFAKLNDMVKGLDGVLDLDPISIGALNGTFEITDTTITNYGTISTNVLDLSNVHDDTYTFPLVGSLENTLDDTHTMVFNPTLDDDITNVGDITVTYPQNPSIPTLKDVDDIENIDDLKFDWTTVFPFCIPFDFIKFLKVLCSDPITPEINWNYDLAGFKGTLNLSLKDYNDVASLLRKMETFSFILFLIFKTRELIRG